MARMRKIPQRMCIACREMKDKKDLIRVVRTPDGDIEIDSSGKKAGRGAYLCANMECVKKSVKKNVLEKALDRKIPAQIIDDIEKHIESISS